MRHTMLWLMEWVFCHQSACWRRTMMGGLADDTDASRYLSAFKQRALDAALESGARVKGVAYIDDQGRLHERAMFSTEADVRGIQVESYLEAMGGEEGLDAVQVSDDARCQLWTGSGAESGLVSINIAASPTREASERALQQTQEALLVEALDRSLRAQGYRVLAPTGPKPDSYQTQPMRGLWWATGRRGPRPTLGDGERADARGREEENDLYVNHPGLASIVYVLSLRQSRSSSLSRCPSNSPPPEPRGDFRALS